MNRFSFHRFFARSLTRFAMRDPARKPSPGLVEVLEKRQLLSGVLDDCGAGSLAGDVIDGGSTGTELTVPLAISSTQSMMTTFAAAPTTPALPLVKRVYMGLTNDAKGGAQSALIFKIRKQDSRGSLRGEVRVATNNLSILVAQITYGKIRSNRAITLKFTGNGLDGTVTGKSNTSGSQIKGSYVTTGARFKGSGTFTVKKYVGIG
jgi:hypothetical protein